MKYLPLIWRNLLRRKVRTIFTLASVFIAFVLYSFLMVVQTAFSMGVDMAGADRLMLMHKVSLIQLLPISYQQHNRDDAGRHGVSTATWFGGTLPGQGKPVRGHGRRPRSTSRSIPEATSAEDQMQGLARGSPGRDRRPERPRRNTAGRSATRSRSRRRSGSRSRARPGSSTSTGSTTATATSTRRTSSFTTSISTRTAAARTARSAGTSSGSTIRRTRRRSRPASTAQFANSSAETKTSTEKAFLQGFVNQVGNIKAMIIAILAAVLFTLFLLVLANTMAQAVRERTSELAVLKTLGFSNPLILTLVLAESMFLALIGGGLALARHLGRRRHAAASTTRCCRCSSCAAATWSSGWSCAGALGSSPARCPR